MKIFDRSVDQKRQEAKKNLEQRIANIQAQISSGSESGNQLEHLNKMLANLTRQLNSLG